MPASTAPDGFAGRDSWARSPFVRSDVMIALVGSLLMAVAGAGVASWFGPGEGGAAFADSYSTNGAQN